MGHSSGEPGCGEPRFRERRLGERGITAGPSAARRFNGARSAALGLGLGGALVLASALTPPPLRAGDLSRDCRRWASASGSARIALANQLGAEHLLTKNTRLAESDPAQPVELYRLGDLQRLCRGS